MVYVVGPDCGGRVGVVRTGGEATFQLQDFLYVVMLVSRAVMSTVIQYNQAITRDAGNNGGPQDLPEIRSLRMCLLSGGSYKHPEAPKFQVAKSVMEGVIRGCANGVRSAPMVIFAYDSDSFRRAWTQLDLHDAELKVVPVSAPFGQKEEDGQLML